MSAAPTVTLNRNLFLPFFASTKEVLALMAGVDARIGTPYKKLPPFNYFDVTGQISFYGDIVGIANICLPGDTADRLVEKFAGTRLERNSADYSDAVGELANMIAGSAKKSLGVDASITTPTVILGNHTVVPPSAVPCIVIPGTADIGSFVVEVCIKLVPAGK